MNRPLNRPMITLSIMLATIMQTLDSTIANVALPHMQGTLSASQDQIAWVLTAYIIASAIATPVTGWLCDRFGQKNIFMASITGFTVASALCGMSNSLAQIVAARLLQGVFGAALVPLAQVVLMQINPREKQGQAMAVWGMGVMVGPILGPTLGGWLTDSYSWRWVFFINVPIGIIAFYGMWRYIRPDPGQRHSRFDFFGFATLSLALGSLQLLLDRGQQNDWFSSTEAWIEAIVAFVAATYFVAHTAMTPAKQSFLDYRLLKNQNYVTGLLFIFIVGLVLYATRALIPTMLENLLGYPVATTGLVTAPTGIGTMFAMLIAGHSRHRYGFGVRALERGDFCHLESRNARAGDFPVQPGSQYRQQHRHLVGAGAVDSKHGDRAFLPVRARDARQLGLAQPCRIGGLRCERSCRCCPARQRSQSAGGHDRLHR
jgi:DHA2 family multidrug resistance protein